MGYIDIDKREFAIKEFKNSVWAMMIKEEYRECFYIFLVCHTGWQKLFHTAKKLNFEIIPMDNSSLCTPFDCQAILEDSLDEKT